MSVLSMEYSCICDSLTSLIEIHVGRADVEETKTRLINLEARHSNQFSSPRELHVRQEAVFWTKAHRGLSFS